MNKLNLNISARRAAANEVDNFGLPHAVIDLTIAIDGKVLCATDEYVGNNVILDGYAVLATLKSTHPRYFLTCGCGEPGCAGIFDDVRIARDGQMIEWIFPKVYHPILVTQGFPNSTTFRFDQHAYDAQMRRVVAFARRVEKWMRMPASIGSAFHYSGQAFPDADGQWLFRRDSQR
jgi:hypothetical protein